MDAQRGMSNYWSKASAIPPQVPFLCPFFWLQSHKWHEASTAGLASGMLLKTRHSPARKCQPHKFSCCSADRGVSDHGNYGKEAVPVCSMSLQGRLPLENYSQHTVEKPQQFCSFSPPVSSELLTDSHKHLLCLLFLGAFLVSVVTTINPTVT